MLSFTQAAAGYGHDSNPRWIYCHAELGHRPALTTYIVWLGERRAEFLRTMHGPWETWYQLTTHEGPAVQVQFDEWLAQRHERLLERSLAPQTSGRRYARV